MKPPQYPPKAASWRFVVFLFYIAMLAGRYGLDRIDPEFERLGLLGEPRVWLFVAVIFMALRFDKPTGDGSKLGAARRLFFALIILLHFYLAMTALWTPALFEGSERVSNVDEVCSVLLLAASILLVGRLFWYETEEKVRFLFLLLVITSIVYALGGLSGLWDDGGAGDRMASFGGGPNVFARIEGMGVFGCLYYWLKTHRLRWLFPIPLFLGTLVLSGSRGGLFSFVLSFLFFFMIGLRKFAAVLSWTSGGLAALLTLASVSLLSSRVLPFWQYRFVEMTFEDRYDASRLVMFSDALHTFADHPVWGIGLDGFRRVSELGEYTHNLFLQIGAEGGTIGLVLLLLTLGAGIRMWRWSRSAPLEDQVLFSLAVLIFLAQMSSGSYYDSRFMWAFLGILWLLRAWRRNQLLVSGSLKGPVQAGLAAAT